MILPLWLALVGCKGPADDTADPEVVYPRLVVGPEDRELLLGRIGDEPYAGIYADIVQMAARDYEEEEDDAIWDHGAHGHNGTTAEASAFLAWLNDDEAAAEKAIDFFERLQTDFETNDTWDVNIRMPHVLISHTNALDYLQGTPWLTDAQATDFAEKITTINGKFYDGYVLDDTMRGTSLGFSQNNHPIRTASTIGYVGLAFPDHPDAEEWADWAISELDYLWGPTGQYVQADGGVSEGPFYYGFALGPSLAIFTAMDRAIDPERVYHRDCINRQDIDPWAGHGCVDGEAFTFDNPLYDQRFHDTVTWWITLRLPSGLCPNLGDARFNPLNGGPILADYGGDPITRWNWEDNTERPFETGWGMELQVQHLLHVDPEVVAEEPAFTTAFLPVAGNAVFRSDWGHDARWLLLVGESGSARKTLHDHVDGTSFSLAAYGEYLLVDPGYYKPNELNNAVTSGAKSHNVILIDGRGAPAKGLLTNFGDADALIDNTWDGAVVDYAEALQSYEETDITRGVAFVRDRYFVVADRLATTHSAPREHAWRLGGYAGFTSGGTFELRADGARWERTTGGVEVFLASTAPGLTVSEPPYSPLQAPHVHEFALSRATEDHAVIDGVVSGPAPGFLAVLAPYRVGDAGPDGPLSVTPLLLGADIAGWEIVTDSGTDIALLRAASAPESVVLPGGQTITTDAAFTLFSLDEATFSLVADGSSLSVDQSMRYSGPAAEIAVIENR